MPELLRGWQAYMCRFGAALAVESGSLRFCPRLPES